MKFSVRLLYLYLFSFVGLLITVIGSVQLVNLGLKTYVFHVSEYAYFPEVMEPASKNNISVEEAKKRNNEEQLNQRKREASNALAMIVIGAPLYLYHWKTIKKEKRV